jgi:Zn-finger nucleic acid-binding protein
VGAASLGRKYDKIDDINCPICNVAMDKIEDPVQTHIWMEACPSCERVFLDAG